MGYSIFPDGKYGEALEATWQELNRAKAKFPDDLKNQHEGYAVMKEEVEEMWDEVKADNPEKAVAEAVQVAAMAIRFIAETGKYPYVPFGGQEVSHE